MNPILRRRLALMVAVAHLRALGVLLMSNPTRARS
jgi:hypothetical protein